MDKAKETVGNVQKSAMAKAEVIKAEAMAKAEIAKAEAKKRAEQAAASNTAQNAKRRSLALAEWSSPNKGWDSNPDDSIETKLYRKFEITGKRPEGSVVHELIALTIVSVLVVVPAALLRTVGWRAMREMGNAFADGNYTEAQANLYSGASSQYANIEAQYANSTSIEAQGAACAALSTSTARNACWAEAYLDVGLATFDFWFFAVGWPAIWLSLVVLAYAGKLFDWTFRKVRAPSPRSFP